MGGREDVAMPVKLLRGQSDPAVRALRERLQEYQATYPDAEIELYRSNPACIRVRVVDRRFGRMGIMDRHDHLWEFLSAGLPDDVMSQISVLLGVTPAQAKWDNYRLDFDDPAVVSGS
jgi:hypothetical protein